MTTLVLVMIGAGAVLIVSGVLGITIAQAMHLLWNGITPPVDVTQTARWTTPQPRNVR